MSASDKLQKKKNWEYAINMNQIDGAWEPSNEFKELIEKEINGEITTQQIREILNKKYTIKNLNNDK